jgi:uncharacterized phage infection (PIP) family protein YhgE
MKKFLLVALISGSAFAASAQSSFGKNNNNDRNYQTAQANHKFDRQADRQRELDNRVAAINNDYNRRIDNIQHQPFIRTKDKRKQIKQLQRERIVALQQCRDSYSRNYGSVNNAHRF